MAKKVKVEWLKLHPRYAYFVGDCPELDAKAVDELIKSKHVKLFVAPKPEEIKVDLPDDLPGRDALIANNVKTMDDVKLIDDFTKLNGIGKAINEQILTYLNAE